MPEHPWRRDLVIAMAVVFLVASGLRIAADSERIEDSRNACERQNVRTQLQYEKYLADEKESRLFSEQQPPGPVKRITAEAADTYAASAQKLIDLVVEDGVSTAPDSPQTDCSIAYPEPFPFNVIGG